MFLIFTLLGWTEQQEKACWWPGKFDPPQDFKFQLEKESEHQLDISPETWTPEPA